MILRCKDNNIIPIIQICVTQFYINLQAALLGITGTGALVLRAGGVELIAYGGHEAATGMIVALIELDMVVIDHVAVAAAIQQVFASQFDAQAAVEEGLDQADVKHGLVIVEIDVLIVSCALIVEIEFASQ